MLKALVADIERCSTKDGPGIRTTVFFKGCPLRCSWCHNPECISFEKEILYYPEKCIHCNMCDKGCFTGAKVVCGKEMYEDELLKEIALDKDYYGENGGVTFSGGEPLAQSEFLNRMIDLCHENHIKTAVETSLYIYKPEIFKKLDIIMADLKIWNDELHKKYTGVSNTIIKEHFKEINKLDIPIIARTPVIPEINQGIPEISDFLKNLKNVKQYELLPYHPLGISKQKALGREIIRYTIPGKEIMKELDKYAFIR